LVIFRHFVKLPAKSLYTINRFRTTFETFAELECVLIDNSVWGIENNHPFSIK